MFCFREDGATVILAYIKKLAKFGHKVIEICERTDRHAHRNTSHIYRSRSNNDGRVSVDI